ncbi:MAG: hypothetical protein WDN48_17480 [Pseudolabrys sp.]
MKTAAVFAVAFGLLAVPALAESSDEQQACMNDAFRVCASYIPDRAQVTSCMVKNKSQLSAPCRAVMARYTAPAGANTTQSARSKAESARAEAY